MIWVFAQLLCSNNFPRKFSVITRLPSWRSLIKLASNPYDSTRIRRRLAPDHITDK
jgi:hypothetical protein